MVETFIGILEQFIQEQKFKMAIRGANDVKTVHVGAPTSASNAAPNAASNAASSAANAPSTPSARDGPVAVGSAAVASASAAESARGKTESDPPNK